MESFLFDTLSLIVRWLHVITGIAWVGASFYFIWLDNSLDEPPAWKADRGIKGDLWSFHGGGIYEVAKYRLGPAEMPGRLHWFYWEAYSTWLSGMGLLFLVYYLQASSFLLAPDSPFTSPLQGVLASLVFILSGYLLYEALLRSGVVKNTGAFVAFLTLMLSFYSWLSVQLFSDRAAYMHMGILLGTIMAANVFVGIIPPQRRFVKEIEAGLTPTPEPLLMAKLRSTHNNYFTLPVLFCMISNHYPFLYGHRYNWLIMICIIAITAGSRQFFNLKHKRIYKPSILVTCGVLFVTLMSLLAWDRRHAEQAFAAMQVSDLDAMSLISTHCAGCHSASPTFPGFAAPPLGVILSTPAQAMLHADKAKEAVATNYMPLGNITHISDDERQKLVAWLTQQAKK